MAKIIDGKKISAEIKEELKTEVAAYAAQGKTCALAVIQVGADPASSVYVRNKKKACAYIGIESLSYELPEETTEEELLALIQKLNDNPDVHGILCQLPLPKHICEDHVIQAIDPQKDVDGFHPQNVGALVVGKKGFVSCTPAGIIQLLKRSNIEIAGKHCGNRKKQHCRKTDGASDASGKCNGYDLSFTDRKSQRNLQRGGYSDCGHWKTTLYRCRLYQRRSGCHRCRNS